MKSFPENGELFCLKPTLDFTVNKRYLDTLKHFHDSRKILLREIQFSPSGIAVRADGSQPFKNQWEIGPFSSPGSQKVTFSLKVTFSPKSDYWTPKSKKCGKVTFGRKSRTLTPGDRKKH